MATSTFSFSDSDFTFWTPRRGSGRFILRSRRSGYEHEFDFDGESLYSVATIRLLSETCRSFTSAVNAAKSFMRKDREDECMGMTASTFK